MKKLILLLGILFVGFSSKASELFIKVINQQEHYVTVQGQSAYNPKNIFKFFDLNPGSITVAVMNRSTNTVLSSTSMVLAANERVVVEIIMNGAFNIIQRIPIQEINWYITMDQNINGGYPNTGVPKPGYPNPGYPNPGFPNGTLNGLNYVNDVTFQQFLVVIKNETMDNNRLKNAKNFVTMNALSATQIAEVSKTFTFDNNRLEFAKLAYRNCYDKGNYFLLKETFSFSNNYNNLLKYIDGK